MSLITTLENEIKALNEIFHDHNERFTPQALAMIEARIQRTGPLKSILQNRELPGWSWIYLMKPIETYIAEIESIYKLQALFPTKENLEKIKASCNILSAVHDKLKAIPAEEHDETSLTYTNAFLTQLAGALSWGDIFFKQLEILDDTRAKLIAKSIELQQLRAQEQAKSLHTNAFFFGNLFYNPAYAA